MSFVLLQAGQREQHDDEETADPSGHVEVTPVTAEEHRRIDRRSRSDTTDSQRYKEIRGKKVDWIDHHYCEGFLYVGIRFTDGTYFSLEFSPSIVTERIEFSDMSSGDDVIIASTTGGEMTGEWR